MEYAHKLFSTRGGTLLLAGLTALIAAIAVFAYVKHYRNSVQEGGVPATVLVSSAPIVKGHLGAVVATKHLYQAQTIRESQLREGAISDPASLRGTVAKTDILPRPAAHRDRLHRGQWRARVQLAGTQRAITISIDAAHGMIGQLKDGRQDGRLCGIQRQSRRFASAGRSAPGRHGPCCA